MGNVTSTVRSVLRPKEEARRRQQNREQAVNDARARVQQQQQAMSEDTRLSKRADPRQQLAATVSHLFDQQLQRNGKSFVKADLMGILLFVAVLKGEPLEAVIQRVRDNTCEDLRVDIRTAMYASPETMQALQEMANPTPLPVAVYAPAQSQSQPQPQPQHQMARQAQHQMARQPQHYPRASSP